MNLKAILTTGAILAFAAGAAHAGIIDFAATLKGASEVPANTTTGKGELTAELDTNNRSLTYTVTYSGLTGPATGAHFHGPAAPGADAPVVIAATDAATPISGSATLTDAQIADLKDGKWYFNVHTKANPGGEIRGQVKRAIY